MLESIKFQPVRDNLHFLCLMGWNYELLGYLRLFISLDCNVVFRDSSKIVETKLKEIGKLFKEKKISVTRGQGTDSFADNDLMMRNADMELVEVLDECNK